VLKTVTFIVAQSYSLMLALRSKIPRGLDEWKNTRICEFSSGRIRIPVYFIPMIRSFADAITETIFLGGEINRKDARKLGGLNTLKAFERLAMLHEADENTPLVTPFLHYHKLKGTTRYSIDAESRKSPWRITFQWESAEMKDVQLVKIEDTH
jgi:plasmid maintenance system killer protein